MCVCVVVGQATCYPALMEKLAAYVAATSESRVQVDGTVVTSRAPGTTMEFAIALIEQLIGKEKAYEVAGPLVRTSFTAMITLVVFEKQRNVAYTGMLHITCWWEGLVQTIQSYVDDQIRLNSLK